MKLFGNRKPNTLEISPPDAHAAIGAGSAILVDVREISEWVEGHIPSTHHIPLQTLPLRIGELPRDRTVLVICRSGNRSLSAARYLQEQGFDTRSIAGGIGVWATHGLPVTR
jgi:rhodanese-related sulfurtransferase